MEQSQLSKYFYAHGRHIRLAVQCVCSLMDADAALFHAKLAGRADFTACELWTLCNYADLDPIKAFAAHAADRGITD